LQHAYLLRADDVPTHWRRLDTTPFARPHCLVEECVGLCLPLDALINQFLSNRTLRNQHIRHANNLLPVVGHNALRLRACTRLRLRIDSVDLGLIGVPGTVPQFVALFGRERAQTLFR
jgi:hypothetical protein